MKLISDHDLARLYAHLAVPVAVSTALDGDLPMDDSARMALCDMIGAQTPDQALLSIAFGAIILDARMREAGIRAAEVLALSAEMMVQDYAPPYLTHLDTTGPAGLFAHPQSEILKTIPEDLESLSDLLAIVADVIPENPSPFRDVAEVLSAQAGAQAMVAEAVFGLIYSFDPDDWDDDAARIAVTAAQQPGEDNVVPFKRS